MKIRLTLPSLLFGVATLIGCGGGAEGEPKDRPARTPVSGIVTLKGVPVESATVTFFPLELGSAAVGRTNAEGRFVLGTFSADDGAIPGTYQLSVVKLDEAASASTAAHGDPSYTPSARPKPTPPPKHLLPVKYSDQIKSNLKEEVGTDPITDLQIKLE